MKIVSLSYARNNDYKDPESWISRIESATRVLEAMAGLAEVVSVHCIGYEGIIRRSGLKYVFLQLSPVQILFPVRLHQLISDNRPDIVIVHGIIFSWQIILLRMKLGPEVKIFVQHHAERPWGGIRGVLQRLADSRIDTYLFAARDLAEPWIARGLIARANKVQEFMSASALFTPYDRASARQATHVVGERVYLWVGRLDSNKDPVTALNAFIRFAQKNRDATFYLIYQTSELVNTIKTIIDQHPEIQNNVHLVGRVAHADLRHWYSSADFVISASHYESGGLAICEAMSCGCIPIVTDIPAFRTMTGHGTVGLFFRPGDEDGLLDALLKSTTLDLEQEKRKVLDHFEKELSFEAIAGKLFKIVSLPRTGA